jgi:hypothetical protein
VDEGERERAAVLVEDEPERRNDETPGIVVPGVSVV